MTHREREHVRPLCPTHYRVMVGSPGPEVTVEGAALPGAYHFECPERGCGQNYSPGFGYFTIAQNEDYWVTTSSHSMRIRKNSTQVLCGEHKHAMFLASCEAEAKLWNFLCPQKDCPAQSRDTDWSSSRLLDE